MEGMETEKINKENYLKIKRKAWKAVYQVVSLLECEISSTWLVKTACIFLIFLIATVILACEAQKSQAVYTKNFNLRNLKHTCVCIG